MEQEFISKLKKMEQELTDLKSGKKISTAVKFNMYKNKEFSGLKKVYKITYADGDQPIITDAIFRKMPMMLTSPSGNVQYIIFFGQGSAVSPDLYSTREIVKVEAL